MAKRLTDQEIEARARLRSEVGERLRLVRRALGTDQGSFGLAAGIEPNTYNQIENGKKFPSYENAIALCDTYNISMDWIFRGHPGDMSARLWEAIKALKAIENMH